MALSREQVEAIFRVQLRSTIIIVANDLTEDKGTISSRATSAVSDFVAAAIAAIINRAAEYTELAKSDTIQLDEMIEAYNDLDDAFALTDDDRDMIFQVVNQSAPTGRSRWLSAGEITYYRRRMQDLTDKSVAKDAAKFLGLYVEFLIGEVLHSALAEKGTNKLKERDVKKVLM